MKKQFYFFACAAAALAMASCQKKAPADAPVVPADLQVITASIDESRTTTEDGVHVLWENGDIIGLRPYSGEEAGTTGMVLYQTSIESPAARATFVKVDGQEESAAPRNGKYIALYPSNPLYKNWAGKYERILIGLDKPGEQVVPVGGGWDTKTSLMIATSTEDADFTFRHVMSYFKFTVDDQSPVFDKVIISSKSDMTVINRINIYYDGHCEINNLKSYASTSVAVTNTAGTAFGAGTFYAAVLPQSYTGGFTFSFFNGELLLGSLSYDDDLLLTRGDVANLGAVRPFSEPTVEPLELGTVFYENNKAQGVVFWIDPDDPYTGKVVSVATDDIQWAVKTYNGDADDNPNLGGTDTNDGLANFTQVTTFSAYLEDANNFPATKFCADLRASLGGDWYLPVLTEMRSMHDAYYGLASHSWTNGTDYRWDGETLVADMTVKAKFDAALATLGETTKATLDGDANCDGVSDNAGFGTANGVQYWLSKVNSNGNAQYFRVGNFQNSNGPKTSSTSKYARCVRNVTAQAE